MTSEQEGSAKIGHNHLNPDDRRKLNSIISQIIGLENEKQELHTDIAALYESAKDAGFSKKAVRAIVREKMMSLEQKLNAKRLAETVDQYRAALGMLEDTPLGEAAIQREYGEATVDVSTQPFRDNDQPVMAD